MCLMACVAFSQNLLEITDISQPNDVYTGDNDRAAVIFKCNQSIPLTFESSMDKSATPYNTELEGSDMVYYIEFPTGQKYRGRMLTITSPGYAPATVFIDDLQPKQVLTYQAIDPNRRQRWSPFVNSLPPSTLRLEPKFQASSQSILIEPLPLFSNQ